MSENLKHIKLYKCKKTKTLVIQLEEGGASIEFYENDNAYKTILALRMLAEQLEHDVKSREFVGSSTKSSTVINIKKL